MLKNQIHSMIAAFLQTCTCKIKDDIKLSDLGITGDRLRNFKNLIQHNYGSPFNEMAYTNWQTVGDVVSDIEDRMTTL